MSTVPLARSLGAAGATFGGSEAAGRAGRLSGRARTLARVPAAASRGRKASRVDPHADRIARYRARQRTLGPKQVGEAARSAGGDRGRSREEQDLAVRTL